jgi:GNAT superfamily N-acetyltransferase
MFDIPPHERSTSEWTVSLPLHERDWGVGLIVGPSGAGKTSVARALFPEQLVAEFAWPAERSILDAFPEGMSIKDITGSLTAVGFGSPPAWFRPYASLSTGEQFRVTIARALAESPDRVVIDEFTSTVDRQVAQVASHAIQKAVRRAKRQLVAVTCHYDVVDWLQPDWIYQPHTGEFAWRFLQRHPPLELRLHSVHHSVWPVFARHHYLSSELNKSAVCFGGWIGDELVGFTSYLHLPHYRVKNVKLGHRLVVLPDYQGLGIGGRMDDWLGQKLYEEGYRYHNVVSHPAMIAYYSASPRWRLFRGAGAKSYPLHSYGSLEKNPTLVRRHAHPRNLQTMAFEYVPPIQEGGVAVCRSAPTANLRTSPPVSGTSRAARTRSPTRARTAPS